MASLRPSALITDFTGGELSPRWQSRVAGGGYDPLQGGGSIAARYASACKELTNCVILPQGGIATRQALQYVRDLTHDVPAGADLSLCRVVKYEAAGSDFLAIFSDYWLGVYDTSDIAAGAAQVFTTETVYPESALASLDMGQYQDSLVFFWEGRRPRRLKRANGVWTFIDTVDDGFTSPTYFFNDSNSPPRVKALVTVEFANNTDRRYYVRVSGYPTNHYKNFLLKASDPTTTASNFLFAIDETPSVVKGSAVVTHTGGGPTDHTYEVEYEFYSHYGDGSGLLELSVPSLGIDFAVASDEFTIVEDNAGSGGNELLWSGPLYVENGGSYYQCIAAHISEADNEPGTGVDWEDYWVLLGVSVPDDDDYTEAPTNDGAWDEEESYYPGGRGWPSAGTVHEQRVIANGPPAARGVIAGSRISRQGTIDYLDFTVGVNDADGFLFLLAVENGASVNGLHSESGYLFITTSVGLFVQLEIPFTPTNVQIKRQGDYTIGNYKPFSVAGEVFYVQRNGRQVRRVQFVNELQSWQAADLTSPVEHWFRMTAFGVNADRHYIVDQAYQNAPDSLLWVVRNDGTFMSLTYERYVDVAGWAKHSTRFGNVTSMEPFYGSGLDGVAVLVVRENGEGEEFLILEVLPETSRNEYTVELDEGEYTYEPLPADEWPAYLDSSVTLEGDGTNVLAVPARFNGLPIDVVEEGAHLGQFTPVDGVLTMDVDTEPGKRIYAGLLYKQRARPVKFEGGGGYTSQAAKLRWVKPTLRLFNSVIPKLNGRLQHERVAQTDNYNSSPLLFTGDIELNNLGFDGELLIENDLPLPMHVTGVFGTMQMEGK